MNEARFMALLSAYGAELSRWPDDERGPAEALLEVASHRLKDIWESERVFDHLLALEKDNAPSIALEAKVIASSPQPKLRSGEIRLFGKWTAPQWATGGAIAASLALGFAAGYAAEPAANGDTEYAQVLTLAGGSSGSMLLTAVGDAGN